MIKFPQHSSGKCSPSCGYQASSPPRQLADARQRVLELVHSGCSEPSSLSTSLFQIFELFPNNSHSILRMALVPCLTSLLQDNNNVSSMLCHANSVCHPCMLTFLSMRMRAPKLRRHCGGVPRHYWPPFSFRHATPQRLRPPRPCSKRFSGPPVEGSRYSLPCPPKTRCP